MGAAMRSAGGMLAGSCSQPIAKLARLRTPQSPAAHSIEIDRHPPSRRPVPPAICPLPRASVTPGHAAAAPWRRSWARERCVRSAAAAAAQPAVVLDSLAVAPPRLPPPPQPSLAGHAFHPPALPSPLP